MVFKLTQLASRRWQKLNAVNLVLKVMEGAVFEDGILTDKMAA
jgi:hypothetical protein